MGNFSDYLLNEKDWVTKLTIMNVLSERKKVFFDKTVVFKVELTKLFIEIMGIDVDENLVLTAGLLYSCKKNIEKNDKQKYIESQTQFLQELGFEDRFCKICEQVYTYSPEEQREKEADILFLMEHFGELLLDKPERKGYETEKAIEIMEKEILTSQPNLYKEEFSQFMKIMQEIYI